MNRSRHGLKSLGLALVLLGLTAFMATAVAQAAEWRIEGKKITSTETVTGAAHVASNLLVPAQKLQILCTEHTIEVGNILTNGNASGKLSLKNCKTWQNGKESPGCKPGEPIVAGGLGTPILHNGLTYILIKPTEAGGAFALVSFDPVKCALPEEIEVKGSTITECLNPTNLNTGAKFCEEEAVTHLGQVAPTSLFSTNVLFFGLNPITFDGIAEVKLNGANKGAKASAFG